MKLECRPGVGSCAQEKFQVASNFYRARGSPRDAYLYTIDCELLSVRPGRTHPILNYEEAMMFFEQVAQQLSGSVSPTVSNDGSAVSTVTASTASTLSSTTNTISKQPMYCDGQSFVLHDQKVSRSGNDGRANRTTDKLSTQNSSCGPSKRSRI